MATRQEIRQAIHDELVDTVAEHLCVDPAEAASHVVLAERTTDMDLPGYTFSLFTSDVARGLHQLEVRSVEYGDDGVTVTYARPERATVDVAAHAANDDAQTVSALYDAFDERLAAFHPQTPTQETLHEDVEAGSLTVESSQDRSARDSHIIGERLRFEFIYDSLQTVTAPTMEQIESVLTDAKSGVELNRSISSA